MRWLIPLPYGKELHEWFFRFLCLGGGDIRPQSRTKAYASDAAFCLVATEKLTPDSVLALAVRYNRSFGYSSSSAVSLFDAYVSDVLSICSLITIPSVQRSSYYILILMKENDASEGDSN